MSKIDKSKINIESIKIQYWDKLVIPDNPKNNMKVNQKDTNNIKIYKQLDKMTKKQLREAKRELIAQMRKIEKEEGITSVDEYYKKYPNTPAPITDNCKICNNKLG